MTLKGFETTALEALIAELLGDVGTLHDRIKELPRLLARATDDVSRDLAGTTQALRAAAIDMQATVGESGRRAGASVMTIAKYTTEVARRHIRETATEAAVAAARSVIGAEVESMVASLDKASTALADDAMRARVALVRPTPIWAAWATGAGLVCFGGLLGVLAALLAQQFDPPTCDRVGRVGVEQSRHAVTRP